MRSLLIAIFTFTMSAHAETCAQYFGSIDGVNARLISYLDELLVNGVLLPADLPALEQNIQNNSQIEPRLRSTAARIHARELENYLRDPNLNRQAIVDWIQSKIEANNKTREEQELVRQKTARSDLRMHFVRLPSRKFDYEIEMMDTPVTQRMWLELMGENPSYYKDEDFLDHPVENITWFSAATFANRMSERDGLKPYYDLSHLRTEGRAEAGELALEEVDFYGLEITTSPVTKAEGYRLPEEDEFLSVVEILRDVPHLDFNLEKYAWVESNSAGVTHPVAELAPLPGLGVNIFDFLGNVTEWMNAKEFMHHQSAITRGAFWGDSFSLSDNGDWNRQNASEQYAEVGFRLYRTLGPALAKSTIKPKP